MKKILNIILAICIFMGLNVQIIMAKDDISVILDNKTLSFDVLPQIINDRTMVPLRAIFEALDATVDWDQRTRTVTSTKGNTTISLTIDSYIMYVNDIQVVLDSPACIVNDRTLVPVRAISEAYDTDVDWDSSSRIVIITSRDTQPVYDDDYEEDYLTPKPTPKPKATPKPTPTPKTIDEKILEQQKIALPYEEALKMVKAFVGADVNEEDNIKVTGNEEPVKHNGRWAYEFECSSKKLDSKPIIYIYEDGVIEGEQIN